MHFNAFRYMLHACYIHILAYTCIYMHIHIHTYTYIHIWYIQFASRHPAAGVGPAGSSKCVLLHTSDELRSLTPQKVGFRKRVGAIRTKPTNLPKITKRARKGSQRQQKIEDKFAEIVFAGMAEMLMGRKSSKSLPSHSGRRPGHSKKEPKKSSD
jgi:hypothetical protein